MKMMKKLIVLCLSAILSLSAFSGCVGGGNDENHLEIGYHKAGYGTELIEKVIEDFLEENPQYTIKLNADEGYSDKVETQLQGDGYLTEDDLLLINAINFYDFARQGKLVELSDVYAAEFGDSEGNTIESALLDQAKVFCTAPGPDGTNGYYSIGGSMSVSSFVLNRTVSDYYENLSAWKKSKSKKIDEVETVEELVKWIEQIQELSKTNPFTYKDSNGSGEVKGFVYCGQYMNYWDSIVSTWWAQYSGLDTYRNFFAMGSVDVYSDPGIKAAYEAFSKLDLKNNSISDSGTKDHLAAQNDLIAGRAALMPNGQWIAYESRNSLLNWGTELEMISLPYVDKNHKVDYLYTENIGGIYIPNRPDTNVELAKKFLIYYLSYDVSKLALETNGSLRPYYKGYTDEAVNGMSVYDTFTDGVITLRNNCAGFVCDAPASADSPNWKILRTATASKWPDGSKLNDIIDGKSAETAFNEGVTKARNNFDTWLSLNDLA